MTFCFGHWLSAQAMSDSTRQSDVAKLRPVEKVVDKTQPGPIRHFTWAEPNNSAFLPYIFSVNFLQLHGPGPTIWPFYFLGHGLLQIISISLFLWFSKMHNILIHYSLGRILFRAQMLFCQVEHLVYFIHIFKFTHLNSKKSINISIN